MTLPIHVEFDFASSISGLNTKCSKKEFVKRPLPHGSQPPGLLCVNIGIIMRASIRSKTMTQLLQTAINKLKKLPKKEQDAFALRILEEIEADTKWDELFAKTTDQQWKSLIDQVDKEIDAGNHESMDEVFGK